jgi:hypothetical protein
VQISIEVKPAECPLEWIDRSVMVAVEFCKVVSLQFSSQRTDHTPRSAIVTRVVSMRPFKHSMVREVHLRIGLKLNRYW